MADRRLTTKTLTVTALSRPLAATLRAALLAASPGGLAHRPGWTEHPAAALRAIDWSLWRLHRRGRRLLHPAGRRGDHLDRFDRELASLTDALDRLSAHLAAQGPDAPLPALTGRYLTLAQTPHPSQEGGAPLPEALPAFIRAVGRHCNRLAAAHPEAAGQALQVLVALLFHWRLWLYRRPEGYPGFAPQAGDVLTEVAGKALRTCIARGAEEQAVAALRTLSLRLREALADPDLPLPDRLTEMAGLLLSGARSLGLPIRQAGPPRHRIIAH